MTSNDEESLGQLANGYVHTITNDDGYVKKTRPGDENGSSYWWFLSTAFPMIAGTLGPVASAFSICSITEPWRQQLNPGVNIQDALSIEDPPWLLIIEAIQLFVGLFSNLTLLLGMAKRIRFNIALPITILGWYASSICRITLNVVVARRLKDVNVSEGDVIWSQSFYYGMWAAILYFIDATLLAITLRGTCKGHYRNTLPLTKSQRTLMLQSIMLLLYLLLGAYIFSEVESWSYLDAVYWAFVTLFTVGFGDYYPETDLGRALLIPFALAGIVSLGLVIISVRSLIVEEGSRVVTTGIGNKRREKMIKKMVLRGHNYVLEPIHDGFQMSIIGLDEPHQSELERRKDEFTLMRRIQAEASTRRRWVAMAISTFSWLVLWLLGAVIFQVAEKAYQNWSYFDAFYFCFEAWTTIGYGDLTPVSNAGRSFYVFWSLMALPAMTVLISNASDTVVRIIRDATILVGNVTILPNDRPFRRNVKGLINKVTFGKLFHNQDSETVVPITCDRTFEKGLIGDKDRSQSKPNHDRRLAITTVTGHPIPPSTEPLKTKFSSNSTPDLTHCAQELIATIDFQVLLLSEIQTVANHLQESQPHHYTFEEWTWYLKLLGEDESSSKTHCRDYSTSQSWENTRSEGTNGLKLKFDI
ncbi:outward-rectifier potassium channel tok1 [Fusarium langsethiae]|uniref:Outward-rectifier potassium channel tok1 n=1 Tax=Fusarium langsethiae TaxID=179993 RepID=A0A0M9ERD9_FUSLA|nr:outward-rectifier potassium channel tok1 [Fusarium langsethiae]